MKKNGEYHAALQVLQERGFSAPTLISPEEESVQKKMDDVDLRVLKIVFPYLIPLSRFDTGILPQEALDAIAGWVPPIDGGGYTIRSSQETLDKQEYDIVVVYRREYGPSYLVCRILVERGVNPKIELDLSDMRRFATLVVRRALIDFIERKRELPQSYWLDIANAYMDGRTFYNTTQYVETVLAAREKEYV